MDLTSFVTALSGGESYREKSGLPEFKDIYTTLIADVKDNLLKQAATKLLKGQLLA